MKDTDWKIEGKVEGSAVDAVHRGDWQTCWYYTGETVYRDLIGRRGRGASRQWLVFRLNNCGRDDQKFKETMLIVRADAILELLPRWANGAQS